MDISPRSRLLLRVAGLLTVLAVAIFLPFCSSLSRPLVTVLAMGAFASAFWVATREPGPWDRFRNLLILIQSLAGIGLVVLHPYFLMASLLVVVGWQAALWMSPARAVALVIGQSLVGGLLLSAAITPALLWPSLLSTVGFQVYGLAAAAMARGEANARVGLAAALEDLRIAQAGLADRARADERLRIARDLHDELGHGLTALGLGLRAAERKGQADLGDVRALCGDLLDRLKSVVADMRGPAASLIDLDAALRDLVATTAGADGPDIVLRGDPGPTLVDLARAQVVLRAAQEAITNCRRHARDASILALQIERADDGAIRLSARDDGRGRVVASVAGAGLIGMRERVEALGGHLQIGQEAERGFHLTIDLPVAA